MYWGTTYFEACGGIEVTASHNPINFNGLKMVKSTSQPLDPISDFMMIKQIAEKNDFKVIKLGGQEFDKSKELKKAYTKKLLTFIDVSLLPKLRIMVNSGNGAAGPTFDELESLLASSTLSLIHI